MNEIKFCQKYPKLRLLGMHNEIGYPCEVKLLQVMKIKLESLSKDFLDYDTDNGKYVLPKKGNYLMLIFQKSEDSIFTTLRKYSPEKFDHYSRHVGEQFKLTIETW